MKRSLILGCSHAAGAQMSQELGLNFFKNPQDVPAYEGSNSFPALISKSLGYTVLNHAISGGSNDAMFRILTELIDQLCDRDVVIACWTGSQRKELWYDHEQRWLAVSHGQVNVNAVGPHMVLQQGINLGKTISNPEQFNEYTKQWVLHESHVQTCKLNKIKNILALNAVARSRRIRVINIDTFDPIINFSWPNDIFWPVPNITFCDWCEKSQFPKTKCGHYFKSSHELFANHVLNFIGP